MGDPLSAIAGVVGISGAALNASSALFDLIHTINNAPKEVSSISNDIGDIQSVISNLYTALQDSDVQKAISGDPELLKDVSSVTSPVNNCLEIVNELKANIAKYAESSTGRRRFKISTKYVIWYLKRAELRQYMARVHSHKTNVDAALTSVVL